MTTAHEPRGRTAVSGVVEMISDRYQLLRGIVARAARTTVFALAMVVVPRSVGAAHPTGAQPRCEVDRAIVVRTRSDSPPSDSTRAVVFELQQAGYVVVPGPGCEQGTATVWSDTEGWHLEYADPTREIVVQASGAPDDAPQLVGLHAVELVRAVEVLQAAQAYGRGLQTQSTPRATVLATTPAAAVVSPQRPPSEPPATGTTRWMAELGIAASTIGLGGPRLGVAHHWPSVELGLIAEAGFGRAAGFGSPRSSRSGEGVLQDDWTSTRVMSRAVLELGYVFRQGRRVRPTAGIANALLVPIIGTRYHDMQSRLTLSHLGAGLFWVPAPQVGVRLEVRPGLAIRTAIRAGPTLTVRPVEIAGKGAFVFPGWSGTVTVGLLLGRKSGPRHQRKP